MDNAIWPWRGRQWAHLVSDTSYDELHGFAARLGIPRRAFQGDHYDVPADLRERAIVLGAQTVTGRELITRLRAAGLRRPHHSRVTATVAGRETPAGPATPVSQASGAEPG